MSACVINGLKKFNIYVSASQTDQHTTSVGKISLQALYNHCSKMKLVWILQFIFQTGPFKRCDWNMDLPVWRQIQSWVNCYLGSKWTPDFLPLLQYDVRQLLQANIEAPHWLWVSFNVQDGITSKEKANQGMHYNWFKFWKCWNNSCWFKTPEDKIILRYHEAKRHSGSPSDLRSAVIVHGMHATGALQSLLFKEMFSLLRLLL